eukprot:Nk52_evm40s222 gene=Nk52_evmTU40s222
MVAPEPVDAKVSSSVTELKAMSFDELNRRGKELREKIAKLEIEVKDLQLTTKDDTEEDETWEQFEPPKWCVPIRANVLSFDFNALAQEEQFDVIMMDPPWQLAGQAPTRGVALGYHQLPDNAIQDMPVEKLSKGGFILIWVINNRMQIGVNMMKKWGYELVDTVDWIKMTVNRRLAKCHGFYLQHAKETCLVGRKGPDLPGWRKGIGSDIIYSERRGQSQKPTEIYELCEQLVPNGKYLEIFGRRNNLRDYWVTIGNEL